MQGDQTEGGSQDGVMQPGYLVQRFEIVVDDEPLRPRLKAFAVYFTVVIFLGLILVGAVLMYSVWEANQCLPNQVLCTR